LTRTYADEAAAAEAHSSRNARRAIAESRHRREISGELLANFMFHPTVERL
jgi:hypothetical protein